MLRNSAAKTFYGGFTASKIRRQIRIAVIFPADFRRTKSAANSPIRRSAAAEGSSWIGSHKMDPLTTLAWRATHLHRQLPVGDGGYRRHRSAFDEQVVGPERHSGQVLADDVGRLDGSVQRRVDDLGVRDVRLAQASSGHRRLGPT